MFWMHSLNPNRNSISVLKDVVQPSFPTYSRVRSTVARFRRRGCGQDLIGILYLLQVNPANAPLVVGQLLDDECPEDFIKNLILSVRSLLPVEPLVAECEKRCGLSAALSFSLSLLD